jgi:hypothetical protein
MDEKDEPHESDVNEGDIELEKLSPNVRLLFGIVTSDVDPIEEYHQHLIDKYSR